MQLANFTFTPVLTAHRNKRTAGVPRAILPPHVQSAINREERLLQQGLDYLQRQTDDACNTLHLSGSASREDQVENSAEATGGFPGESFASSTRDQRSFKDNVVWR